MLLITIQQEIRLVDYTNLRKRFIDQDALQAFEFYQIGLSFSICVLILMISQNYNVKGITLFQYVHTCVVLYLLANRENDQNETTKTLNTANMYTLCLGLGLYLYLHQNWVTNFQKMSTNIIDAVSMFQSIFDNSEESTIIITDGKAEYINDTFLIQF